MMKVCYITLVNNEPIMQELGDSAKVLQTLRPLMIGEVKEEGELYCLHIFDGDEPCIIILRNIDDLQIAEGVALMTHALNTQRMAFTKKPI